jgi:cell division protein ZapA (FtsZ GTPase activity inhibitor)
MNFVDEAEEQLAQATELLNQALDAIPEYDRNMELIDKIEAFLGIEPDGEEEEDDEDD